MENLNQNDVWKFDHAASLAETFRHGWAGYLEAALGARTLKEAFDAIDAAMDAQEDRNREWMPSGAAPIHICEGLRPALSHESGTGRYQWVITDRAVIACVMRPRGREAIIIEKCFNGALDISFPAAVERFTRHIVAGLELAKALGVEEEYIEAIPPKEFAEWVRAKIEWRREEA